MFPNVQGYSLTSQRFGESGDLAYALETFHLIVAGGDGAEQQTRTGHQLFVMARREGGWQVVHSGLWMTHADGMEGMAH
jgi:ketosteroid isomerase-like protein